MLHACVILFYKLFEISLKSSFLILAIMMIRRVFSWKIGAKSQYYLWLMLIIRLTIPIVPNSSFSFFNILTKTKPGYVLKNHSYIYDQKYIADWLNTSSELVGYNTHSFSFEYIMPIIWILGVLVFTTYMMVCNIKFRHTLQNSKTPVNEQIEKVFIEYKKKLNITTSLEIKKSNIINSPCLYGLLKPCIFMPKDIEKRVDSDELKFIITHELAHYKRKDILLYLIIYMLQIIYWFNPFIIYGLHIMRSDCEAACDAKVLSLFERDERKKYGLSMIHLLERSKQKSNVVLTTEFVNTKQNLKRRIKMIKLFKKNSYKVSFLTVLVIILMGGLFLTNANSEPYIDDENIEQTPLKANGDSLVEEEVVYEEMIWPVPSSNRVTAPFGKRINPIYKTEINHTGIDIPAKSGESIVTSADGKVVYSGTREGYGKTIIIDHGNGLATMYAHCSELLVEKDEKVLSGTQIAKIGKTGLATGSHLHFEVRKDGEAVNPLDYVKNKEQ